jgi:LDH2 family malate/lactate/ureidoglycolate dehydrogenase
MRGVDTHGVNRIPSYVARIRQGVLDPAAKPESKETTPAVAQVDSKNGFGFVAAKLGMAKAIDMAKIFGIGTVLVKHSNHYGMSAWVVQQVLDAGLMSLMFINSSPALHVWGEVSKLMGVSPIACGAPGISILLSWRWRHLSQHAARFIKRSAVVRRYQKTGH